MEKQVSQLSLDLSLKDEATFENFFAARNDEIVVQLKKLLMMQTNGVIYLCGQRGQGCTHLLQASCHYAHQQTLSSVYLPMAQLMSLSPGALSGFESQAVVCIDDLHLIAGNRQWEEAIFHLYNRVSDVSGRIIFAANDLPGNLNLLLPDLSSRLAWGMVYSLHSLSDHEKIEALMMRAKLRGMTMAQDVAKFILTHCPRHMSTLLAALDVLDDASLAAQRRLTIPFVKEILEI